MAYLQFLSGPLTYYLEHFPVYKAFTLRISPAGKAMHLSLFDSQGNGAQTVPGPDSGRQILNTFLQKFGRLTFIESYEHNSNIVSKYV